MKYKNKEEVKQVIKSIEQIDKLLIALAYEINKATNEKLKQELVSEKKIAVIKRNMLISGLKEL